MKEHVILLDFSRTQISAKFLIAFKKFVNIDGKIYLSGINILRRSGKDERWFEFPTYVPENHPLRDTFRVNHGRYLPGSIQGFEPVKLKERIFNEMYLGEFDIMEDRETLNLLFEVS